MRDSLVNQQIGPYFIQERLQAGGMAVVYKAFDQKRKEVVALKVLRENYIDQPEIVLRFRREAEIARQLIHPHIVQFYDFGEIDGALYMVMRFMAGGSLTDRLKNKANVTLRQSARWLRQVAGALDFAHNQGIIHRDLKIGNILMMNDEDVYLSDFGIARITEATQLTLTGQTMPGTVRYMSPEQAASDPRLDHRSDIYSLGVIAYLLVTGHFPFIGPDQVVIHQHINTPPRKPSAINPDLPPALDNVLLKCLAKNPMQRYNSASELVTAFEKAISGYEDLLVIVDPRGTSPISSSPASTRRTIAAGGRLLWGVLAAIIALAAVIVFLVVLGGGGKNEPAPTEAAMPPTETFTGTPLDPRAAAQATLDAQVTQTAAQVEIQAQFTVIAQENTQTAQAATASAWTDLPIPTNTITPSPTNTLTNTVTPSPTEDLIATANALVTQVAEETRVAAQATAERATQSAQLTANAPTNTPLPTITPSFTLTNTPTATWTDTPTPTLTNTPTATWTDKPTATATNTPLPATVTLTPTSTPTRTALCTLIVGPPDSIIVRAQPSADTSPIVTLPSGQVLEALDQTLADGLIWYYIRTTLEGIYLEGWVRSDQVIEVTECPAEAATLPEGAQALDVQFGESIGLDGYTVQQQDNTISLQLYWRALASMSFDYNSSVRAHSQSGILLAQQDQLLAPPTSQWQPGDLIMMDYRLTISMDSLSGPTSIDIYAGLYDWQTSERLPVIQNGQAVPENLAFITTLSLDYPTPTTPATVMPVTTPPAATAIRFAQTITGQAVNIREGAGTNFAVVGSLAPGFVAQVIGENDDGSWLNVGLGNGGEGWVSADLARVIDLSSIVENNADWTPVVQESDGVEMVLVPAGCFDMGENGEGGRQCFDAPFWIDLYEVTNAQFAQSGGVAANNSHGTDDNQPRERITWFEARDFCQLRGARLPTEAEWEYAARGPDGLVYPWGNDFVADNVIRWDNSNQTAAVGSRPGGVSWVGAYDLSGNVWEWTSTLYQDYPYAAGDGRESNNDTSSNRTLRGGSGSGSYLRAANRGGLSPVFRNASDGFRCARAYAP